jgi:hypothetical protein
VEHGAAAGEGALGVGEPRPQGGVDALQAFLGQHQPAAQAGRPLPAVPAQHEPPAGPQHAVQLGDARVQVGPDRDVVDGHGEVDRRVRQARRARVTGPHVEPSLRDRGRVRADRERPHLR